MNKLTREQSKLSKAEKERLYLNGKYYICKGILPPVDGDKEDWIKCIDATGGWITEEEL